MKHLKLKSPGAASPGLSISASYVIVIPVTDVGIQIDGLQITAAAHVKQKEKIIKPDKPKPVQDPDKFELAPPPDNSKSDPPPDESVGRFVNDWIAGKVENDTGQTIPFCPCLGSSLFKVYTAWCQSREIDGFMQNKGFIGCLKKIDGWSAGISQRTVADLKDGGVRNRKMIVPSESDMLAAVHRSKNNQLQDALQRQADETKARWLTRGFLAFEESAGSS